MKRISYFKKFIRHTELCPLIYILPFLVACEKVGYVGEMEQAAIVMTPDGCSPSAKSFDPQENLLSDINLFLFNEAGELESSLYLKESELGKSENGYTCSISLLKNCRYSIYACANTGNKINIRNLESLMSYRYHLVYPDDYVIGIPMTGSAKNVLFNGQKEINVPLERTMAKISVSIDRSRLYNEVNFLVRRIRVGGTPKNVLLFGESRIEDPDDAFTVGFGKDGYVIEDLNRDTGGGRSKELSLYILENMQGDQLYGAASYKDKFFEDGDPRAEICSFVEIHMDYLSPSFCTTPGKSLIYRFYLGDNAQNFDVRRNVHYHITVAPEGDGLQGDGWRIDKSAIEKT